MPSHRHIEVSQMSFEQAEDIHTGIPEFGGKRLKEPLNNGHSGSATRIRRRHKSLTPTDSSQAGMTPAGIIQRLLKTSFFASVGTRKHLVIGASIEKKVVGYLIGYDRYKDGSFYCWMIGVLPKYRRQGVLRNLMEYTIGWARKNGFQALKIKTRNNRREMLAYLVQQDFLFTEVIIKKDPHEHRIALKKISDQRRIYIIKNTIIKSKYMIILLL